jgi:glutathione S-transferase
LHENPGSVALRRSLIFVGFPGAPERAFSPIFGYERIKQISGEQQRVADNNKQQLTIWGRANSVNVQKVLWCLAELDLAYERIDAGMQFGKNNEAPYLAMNPNGRVPTLVDGDYVLWESNSVMRYLCMAYGQGSDQGSDQGSSIYPSQPKARASVDRWLDWTLSTLQPLDRPVFWALVRTPVEQRDMAAIQKDVDAEAVVWRIVEAQLASRRFIEGDRFTIADIALGAYARRWLGVEGVSKPKLPNLDRWFAQFAARPGFAQFVAPPMT